jgi:hypothetical protein
VNQLGEIRFYEGDNCSQHYIGKLNSDFTQSWDLTLISAPVSSETARSCTLIDVKPGTEVRLYDDTFGLAQQNSAIIKVMANIQERCIDSFTTPVSGSDVEVTINQNLGELGGITRIELNCGIS